MNPTTRFPVALSLLVLLPLASACSPDTFDMQRESGEWQAFEDLSTTLSPTGLLRTCGGVDPLPNAVDDEVGLCLSVQLDTTKLGQAPRTLAIKGEAAVSTESQTAEYTREATQDEAVGAVWAAASCFGFAPEEPVAQAVEGSLRLTNDSATQLSGQLTLEVTGRVGGACGGKAARFDYAFTALKE